MIMKKTTFKAFLALLLAVTLVSSHAMASSLNTDTALKDKPSTFCYAENWWKVS